MTTPASSPPERFLVLDGMRGLAAFAVILDHVPSETLRALLPGRYLAVDFFFVLSGFVLAHAYGQRLERSLSPWTFMRIRLIRLYPLYLLGLVIGAALLIVPALTGSSAATLPQLAANGLLGLAFLPAPPLFPWMYGIFPFNPPAWSLFFELVANLAYALIARFLTWRIFAIGLPIAAVAVAITVLRHDDLGPGWMWPHLDAGLARVIFGFFAGVALYRLRTIRSLPAVPAWLAFVLFIAVLAAPAPEAWRQIFDVAAALLFMPLIVAVAAGSRIGGPAASLCGGLGLLSYGIYVLHVPLKGVIDAALTGLNAPPLPGIAYVALVAAAAALAAALAHRIYDAPVRAFLTRHLVRRTHSPPRADHG